MKVILFLLALTIVASAQDANLRTQQLFVQGQRLETAKVEIPKLIVQLKADGEAARAAELTRLKNIGGTPVLGADRPLRQFKLRALELKNSIKGLLANPPEQIAPQLIEMTTPAPGEGELGKEETRLAFRAVNLEITKTLQWADGITARLAAEVEAYKAELAKP